LTIVSAPARERTRVGWLTVGFGMAGAFRLIQELLTVGPSIPYLVVFVFDAGLAILLIVSGSRVVRNRPRSGSSAIAYWGFLATHSAILLLALLPEWLRSGQATMGTRVLFARFLYYGLILLVAPYAAYVLRTREDPSGGARSALTGWLMVGVLLGGALTGLPILLLVH